MRSLFVRWLASLFIVCDAFASEEEWSGAFHATLHGTLIKKHFSAPKTVKNPPFGWFIELDQSSKEIIADLFNHFSEKEREIYSDTDLQNIRLLTGHFAHREWARDHFGAQVTVEGEILLPNLFGRELRTFNFVPEVVSPEITDQERTLANQGLEEPLWESSSFGWNNEEENELLALPDDQPERLVTMSGMLHLEIINHDVELGDIENGGYPIYCWMVKLDPKSFDIACSTPVRACFQTPASIRSQKNRDELWLTGSYDSEWLCDHVDQTVSVQGYLWHAHTVHHHTPVMLDTDPWFGASP